MTHDPKCPFQPYRPGSGGTGGVALVPEQSATPCQCALIASVRAEEKQSHERCYCSELNAISHGDVRVEHLAIAGEILERRDRIMDEIEEALAEIDPAAILYIPQVDQDKTLVFLGAVQEAIATVRNANEETDSRVS